MRPHAVLFTSATALVATAAADAQVVFGNADLSARLVQPEIGFPSDPVIVTPDTLIGASEYRIELLLQVRIDNDPTSTGLIEIFGAFNTIGGTADGFSAATLTIDDTADLVPGTLPTPDPQGRTGAIPPYRTLIDAGGGNSDPGNGQLDDRGFNILPISLQNGGVGDAVGNWDSIYRVAWTTTDFTPRTVSLTFVSEEGAGGAYVNGSGFRALHEIPAADEPIFDITFIPAGSTLTASLLGGGLLAVRRRRR